MDISWIALALSSIGIFFNAKKKIICWPIWILSTIVWGIFAWKTHQNALLTLQVVFGLFNAYGWWCWKKMA